MERKHTPGPWTLSEWEDRYDNALEVTGADGETICDNFPYYPHPVSPANARLIAAAPDLLEALELLVRKYGEHEDGTPKDLNAYDIACAAIAKATATD